MSSFLYLFVFSGHKAVPYYMEIIFFNEKSPQQLTLIFLRFLLKNIFVMFLIEKNGNVVTISPPKSFPYESFLYKKEVVFLQINSQDT